MEILSDQRAFEGRQLVIAHEAASTQCRMTFGLYLPPQAAHGLVPVLWYLSGLTCTHENAMTKAGAQAVAAEMGVALVFPDTSPRGADVPDDASYDLGQGAGFYVNATKAPWAQHYQMERYITEDLPALLFSEFPLDPEAQGITGHSMGGHGALILAARHQARYRSVSAFAPIANPMASEWGRKQLTAYLGADEAAWRAYDAVHLIKEHGLPGTALIDTGTQDQFFEALGVPALLSALAERRQAHVHRLQEGYDHSYFFVSSLIPDHIRFHAETLLTPVDHSRP